MNEFISVLFSVTISFFAGFFIVVWLGRGLFFKYIKAFASGNILLRVHLDNGGSVYRVGSYSPATSMIKYSLRGKKDVRYCSVVQGAVVSAVRVQWLDVSESSSAPFVFTNVKEFTEEVFVPEGSEELPSKTILSVKDVFDGDKKIGVSYLVSSWRAFIGWDDSSIIRNMIRWALMRPKRKFATSINIKAILIVLAVIIGIFFVISQIQSSGANIIK